jgi:hypothetical protein
VAGFDARGGRLQLGSHRRAASEGTLARGKHRISFTAVELEAGDAARVPREVLGPRLARPLAGFVLRQALHLAANASVEAFEQAVPAHPVFELTVRA